MEEMEIGCPISSSDHNVIKFKLVCITDLNGGDNIYYNYHRGNYLSICEELSMVKWEEEFDSFGMEEM